MKKLFWFFLVAVVVTAVSYGLELGYYYLNLAFIQKNIEALPFNFQIALGFGTFQWWGFVIAAVCGSIVAGGIFYQIYDANNRSRW